jgi:uncharacterized protein
MILTNILNFPVNLDDYKNVVVPSLFQTYSGKQIDLNNINPDDLLIEDIAEALSRLPRFVGQAKSEISVGEHSLHVCYESPEDLKLEGLMDDTSEYLLNDIAKPIKNLLPDYQHYEHLLMTALAKKFKFQYPKPASIKDADIRVVKYEWHQYKINQRPSTDIPAPELIRDIFLEQFYKYERK